MRVLKQMRTVTVWLVLLGFLCGMTVPSVVIAKEYRRVDTEGDPLDGDGIEGEGSSGSGLGDDGDSRPQADFGVGGIHFVVRLVPALVNGMVVFYIEFSRVEK